MAKGYRDPLLWRAEKFLATRKFDECIRLLEPEIVRYHDSYPYYLLLALACLYAGDYGGAHTYFRKAREIKIRSTDVLNGLALLSLRRGDGARAVTYWLEVLDLEPKNKVAKKALKSVEKIMRKDSLETWLDERGYIALLPPLPPRWSLGQRIAFFSFGLFFIALVFLSPFAYKTFTKNKVQRAGLKESSLLIERREELIDNSGKFSRVLTGAEIEKTFKRARSLFDQYRDERAKVELNKLLDSNASQEVKNKALLLKTYMQVPGFDTLKDRIPYAEVSVEPYLYRDCWVIWRGMAANIKEGLEFTDFDLLVGYDAKRTLEGIVPVHLPFVSRIEQERPIEVLARISISSEGGDFILEGAALLQAQRGLSSRPE